jgi:hypothetical protein
MKSSKYVRLPFLITGITALLFSSAAMTIEPLRDWSQKSFTAADSDDYEAPPSEAPAVRTTRARQKCDECGVVQSMRTVEPTKNSAAVYEYTVRLADGSIHVLADSYAANRRVGERIILVGAGKPRNR